MKLASRPDEGPALGTGRAAQGGRQVARPASPASCEAGAAPLLALQVGHARLPASSQPALQLAALAAALDGARGLDLLVTGELAIAGGWSSAAPQGQGRALEAVALRSDDPSLLEIARRCAAARVGLILGYPEACSGAVFSSALFIDRAGCAIANYRRAHLGPAEWPEIAAGGWLTIVPFAPGWRIGLSIGWDLLVPEAARCLAVQGADLLVHLGVTDDRATGLVPARAIENGLPVVAAGIEGLLGVDAEGRVLSAEGLSEGRSPAVTVERRDRPASPLALRRPRLYARLGSIDEG